MKRLDGKAPTSRSSSAASRASSSLVEATCWVEALDCCVAADTCCVAALVSPATAATCSVASATRSMQPLTSSMLVARPVERAAGLLDGLRGRLGELAHLVGDDREAAALLARAGGLDRGVERQQVGLVGDLGDLGGQRDAPVRPRGALLGHLDGLLGGAAGGVDEPDLALGTLGDRRPTRVAISAIAMPVSARWPTAPARSWPPGPPASPIS